MSALHRSDAFYAYISDEGTSPPRSIISSTHISAPTGWSLRYALNAIGERMAFTGSAGKEVSVRATGSENPNCSQ